MSIEKIPKSLESYADFIVQIDIDSVKVHPNVFPLTAYTFGIIRDTRYATTAYILSSDVWQRFIKLDALIHLFDPETKVDKLKHGLVGSLHGSKVLCDSYAHPKIKRLPESTILVLSTNGLNLFKIEK